MLGHMIGPKPKTAATRVRMHEHTSCRPHQALDGALGQDHLRRELTLSIGELQALSRRGLWGIILFLAASAATLYLREAGCLAPVAGQVREFIGELPPVEWLHVALGVSWLSALVIVLGRVSAEGKPCYSWYNVGLPTVFYPLYVFCDPTGANFPAVVAAGLILLLVEHFSVLRYASRALREERSRLEQLNRWSPEE